jgi:flagellar biosynthesis GTPase FlhF
MQIKVFSSPKLHEALSLVRKGLGPEAVILDRHRCIDERGNTMWHVHAARDYINEPDPLPKASKAEELNDILASATRRLERVVDGFERHEVDGLRKTLSGAKTQHAFDKLIRLGVAPNHATDIAEDFSKNKPIAESLMRKGAALTPETKQEIVLLTGPSGSGKTTLAAKIAAHFSLKGISVAFMSTDTERIGGLSVLQTYAEVLDVPFIPLRHISDIASALIQTKAARLLLVDTEGWTNSQLAGMKKQMELWHHIPCSRRFMVIPANMDEADGIRALSQARELGITELALSKLDETTRPGKLINWIATGAAVSYCSYGPEVPEQMGWLSPKALTALLASHAEAKET